MRHAVYLVPPPSHPLAAAGASWLGRDAGLPPPYAPPRHTLVAEPWRYGFHATLKAPMALAAEVREPLLRAALRGIAQRHAPFEMPPLQVSALAGFLALRPLVPPSRDHRLRRLADDCVLTLDHYRAKPSPAELQRRLKPGLKEPHLDNIGRFGYPFVLDEWRLHLTLSNTLAGIEAERADALAACARRHFAAALAQPWLCDALAWFVEPAPGEPLELRERFALWAGPQSVPPS